ncbi:hypothetical protein [Desulforamulus reducens]|uniref:hypothetical protein n=1 Tax=Desulforamulus reducens TaxID=59610 RepID=UPI00059DEDF5|nr:hypothetical protein [Desulforamulus reducens]
MSAQHKRPGKTAKQERQRRANERLELRKSIVVHFPKKWDPERFDGISPGHCVAWSDGRR